MTAFTCIVADEGSSLADWGVAIGLFLLILAIGFAAVIYAQRRMDPRKQTDETTSELTTDQIEHMLENGTISQQEYEVMRQIVIGKTMARTRQADAAPAEKTDGDAPKT
jgi:type VI protein secretion system component VasK